MALRIIHVVETLAKSAGGLPVAVTELAEATAGQAETWIVAPPPGSDEVPLPDSIQRFPDLGALKAALAAAPPKDTILHQHGLWSPIPVRSGRLANALGLPLLISPHGMLEPWALAHHGWRKRLAWLAYQRANLNAAAALHATADSEAVRFQALGLRPPVAVLPLGVRPIPEMPLDPPSVAAPKMRRQALFLSRLHPKKGLDRLLQAWAQVRPEGWELLIAGPDETGHRADMERLADRLAVADCVRFVGPRFDVDRDTAFRRADLFILPSHSENFGLVVAEAMQYGLPVITTTATPWQLLPAAGAGWCVSPTEEGIADALRKATALSDEARQAMGRRGAEWVEQDHCWPRLADAYLALYRWLAGQGNEPDGLRR